MLSNSQVIRIVSVHFDDVKGDRLSTTMRGMSITSDQVRHTLYLISAVHRDHRHAGMPPQKERNSNFHFSLYRRAHGSSGYSGYNITLPPIPRKQLV